MNEEFTPRSSEDGTYETLIVDHSDGIDTLTLNRPESLNAMSSTMILELQHYFGELYIKPEVRVVILKGRVEDSAQA